MVRRSSAFYASFAETQEYVRQIDLENESPNLGETIPDVSKFYPFLNEHKDTPVSEFVETYLPQYIEHISFDPLKAKYFDMFMDIKLRPESDHASYSDMSLSPSQLETFGKNGFVVGAEERSFGDCYYKIFNNDLPVLVTTDSILHAFHKSYDTMLEKLEKKEFSMLLFSVLSSMRERVNEVASQFPNGPLNESLKDVDFFLAVALNLLSSEQFSIGESTLVLFQEETQNYGRREPLVKPILTPVLGSHDEVAKCLQACKSGTEIKLNLFGRQRSVDFSLFKPRGHYAKSANLRQYFRAVNWLGEIDFKIAGSGSNLQQMGAAVLLHVLLSSDKKTQNSFHVYSRAIQTLVGPSDSMDMFQIDYILTEIFKLKTYESFNSEEALSTLQSEFIQATDLGKKLYNNTDNSRSFTFFGKKFTIDAWAQSKMVSHDEGEQIIWNGEKVRRHTSSSVEVAFSTLANNDSVSVIFDRMTNADPKDKFRDGLIFHPNLIAARKTIDSLPNEGWKASVYSYWLAALRKLSVPIDNRFPQAMQTKKYGMKRMTTQLSSWAQLRHDNVLYVQQARRSMTCCDYPAGYVEPFVEFWKAMEQLCIVTGQVVAIISQEIENMKQVSSSSIPEKKFLHFDNFFTHFAKHVHVLHEISVLELENKPMTDEHKKFLKNIVELHQTFGSGASKTWLGWYPSLFYGSRTDVENPDLIVCDTFTNPPGNDDPGCVVHQGLGLPRRMTMAVDSGSDVTVYAGPVYGFYEFSEVGLQRRSDEEWKAMVKDKKLPPLPEWSSYIVA